MVNIYHRKNLVLSLLLAESIMAKLSSQPLKSNPFITYRDPETGVWQVVQSAYLDQAALNDAPISRPLEKNQPLNTNKN